MASKTITVNPSSYISTDYSYYSLSDVENGYTDTDSTTYAIIGLTRGVRASTYLYYTFDLSSIPPGATITSVTCSAKISISSTSTSYTSIRQVQLYAGTTAKGTATTITSTSATTYTLVCGTWTRAELQNARLQIYAMRGSSSTSRSIFFSFYGATLTVTYSYTGLYFKNGNSWTIATSVYKKADGVWVQLSTEAEIKAAIGTSMVVPYMEFPFCNNSLSANQLILSDCKKIVKGN